MIQFRVSKQEFPFKKDYLPRTEAKNYTCKYPYIWLYITAKRKREMTCGVDLFPSLSNVCAREEAKDSKDSEDSEEPHS